MSRHPTYTSPFLYNDTFGLLLFLFFSRPSFPAFSSPGQRDLNCFPSLFFVSHTSLSFPPLCLFFLVHPRVSIVHFVVLFLGPSSFAPFFFGLPPRFIAFFPSLRGRSYKTPLPPTPPPERPTPTPPPPTKPHTYSLSPPPFRGTAVPDNILYTYPLLASSFPYPRRALLSFLYGFFCARNLWTVCHLFCFPPNFLPLSVNCH